MPPRRKKPFDWYHSEARKILAFDIRKGAVKREMSVDTVFNMRPQYAAAGKDEQEARELFEGRLDDEFRRADELTQKAAVEMAALQQDRATHPRPALDAFGRPQWEGSPAQALMRSDIKAKNHWKDSNAISHDSSRIPSLRRAVHRSKNFPRRPKTKMDRELPEANQVAPIRLSVEIPIL